MSNQGYWKDITIINNFHVYTKDQFKTRNVWKRRKNMKQRMLSPYNFA